LIRASNSFDTRNRHFDRGFVFTKKTQRTPRRELDIAR